MNIKEFDIIFKETIKTNRCSFILSNGNELLVKRKDDHTFYAWTFAYKFIPMGRLKYKFNPSGDLQKISVQIRLSSFVMFLVIPIIIGFILSYVDDKSIQEVMNMWPLYVGVMVFAVLMQIIGLILTQNILPKQMEELIKNNAPQTGANTDS